MIFNFNLILNLKEIYQKIYELNEENNDVNNSDETKANVVNLTISPDSDKTTCCKLN